MYCVVAIKNPKTKRMNDRNIIIHFGKLNAINFEYIKKMKRTGHWYTLKDTFHYEL